MKRFTSKSAFTLVEMMMAVMILMLSIGSVLYVYTQSLISSELVWDKTIAITQAQHILEEMKSRDSIMEIATADWNSFIRAEQLNTLKNQKIQIDFSEPLKNPLGVQIRVDWTTRNRPGQIVLKTKFKK